MVTKGLFVKIHINLSVSYLVSFQWYGLIFNFLLLILVEQMFAI